MKKNPVVHFEMPYKDAKRVSTFYETAFGWKMNDTGPAMGGYVVAHTADTDKDNMVTRPGAINGGFYNIKDAQPEPSVVIAVDDLEESMKMVEEAGGEVLGKPQDIPGVGLWVSFRDSEGNRVSMLQAS
jgi:uncharacterized protein